jgi:hypothetical protein
MRRVGLNRVAGFLASWRARGAVVDARAERLLQWLRDNWRRNGRGEFGRQAMGRSQNILDPRRNVILKSKAVNMFPIAQVGTLDKVGNDGTGSRCRQPMVRSGAAA